MPTPKLPPNEFADIVRRTPLVSIDLLVRDAANRVLLGLRQNQPARGFWFVPGGVVRKDETLAEALARISVDELDIPLAMDRVSLLGVYEHFYRENFAEKPGFGTHYVVLAYQVSLDLDPAGLPADQHRECRWFTVPELLDDPRVHENTNAYFVHETPPAEPGASASPLKVGGTLN